MRPYANWPCRRCKFSIFRKSFCARQPSYGKVYVSHILFMRQPDLQPRIFLLFSSVRAPHLTRTRPLNYEKRLDKFFFRRRFRRKPPSGKLSETIFGERFEMYNTIAANKAAGGGFVSRRNRSHHFALKVIKSFENTYPKIIINRGMSWTDRQTDRLGWDAWFLSWSAPARF